MNINAELLNYIYKNSQMGVETIDRLLKSVKDEEFRKHLEKQHNGYGEIHTQAETMLNKNGFQEKGLNKFDKIKINMMMKFETLKDNSVSHIAEMLIIGSNMGIINAVKKLKDYSAAEEEIISLMEKLKAEEENNIKELQKFL